MNDDDRTGLMSELINIRLVRSASNSARQLEDESSLPRQQNWWARLCSGRRASKDRKGFARSKSKRDAAIALIAKYRPYYAKLISELDEPSHAGVIYGKKPTIEVRAPFDSNE